MISPSGAETLVSRSLNAMGCRFEFLLSPCSSTQSRFGVEAIADEMVDLVLDWHNRLTVFSPASIVSIINRQPVGEPVAVDRDLFDLLRLSETLRIETHGAFNIAAGTLMQAYGFRGSDLHSPVESLDLDHAITLNPADSTITRNGPRVSIDFGAIAKGFVLDLIRRELISYGIEHAFIHGGTSSAIALGQSDAQHPWRVRVSQRPGLDAQIGTMAIGVSEIGARETDDPVHETRAHIMDTRTNTPAQCQIERVVCAHPSAAIADAYSTALNVRPDLIDTLHEHGCSIAVFAPESARTEPIIRDRLGIFSTSLN